MKYLLIIYLVLLGSWGRVMASEVDEKVWNQVYEERIKFIEENIGDLPDDILKIGHMTGVWPGGGLYKFKANKLGDDLWVYTTFGFTNPDMPTSVTPGNVQVKSEGDRVTQTSATLQKKNNVPNYPDRLGYGYEVMIVTKGEAEWPLWFLQWVANAELINDADILGRVEKYNGLTVEDIGVGKDGMINVLFHKAKAPLPTNITLPNASPPIIVATVITDDEMIWSKTQGRDKLLSKLDKANIGQISDISRKSVINTKDLDLTKVTSSKIAQNLYTEGLLRKVYLFPLEFGGQEIDVNTIYLPKSAAIQKILFEENVIELGKQGLIDNYSAKPEYKGKSFIPSKIVLEATGKQKMQHIIDVF